MTVLAAIVVVVGCLCLIDLLMTFGIVRRLREHAALLARMPADALPGLAVGERPAPFEAISTSGRTVTGPAGIRMAAFFSTSCSVCPGTVDPFLRYVKSAQLRPDHVLAVVATDAEPGHYAADLSDSAMVCLEPIGGPAGAAFGLGGFPSFFLLNADGVIVASAFDPDSLGEPVPA